MMFRLKKQFNLDFNETIIIEGSPNYLLYNYFVTVVETELEH
jgi:hypothetical protein